MWGFSFVILVSALITFAIALAKNNKNLSKLTVLLAVLGYSSFIYFYTDTLFDAVSVAVLILTTFAIMVIPCYRISKGKSYVLIYILSHFIAVILMSGIKRQMLIYSPSHITFLIMIFAYIYMIAKNNELLKTLSFTVISIILSFAINIDYTLPNEFVLYPSTEVVLTTQSKPIIAAYDTFKKDHPSNTITYSEEIHKDDHIYVYFEFDSNKQNNLYYHYENGRAQLFDNTQ
jgi:hypothetical protein